MSQMVSKDSNMLSSTNPAANYFNPSARGYHAVYHDGEVNHCPGLRADALADWPDVGRMRLLLDRSSAQGSCHTRPRGCSGFLEWYASNLFRT